jgi:hypothetical protein
MICLRDLDDRLTGLVKKLDEAAGSNRSLDAFVIVCSDDKDMEKRARALIDKHGVVHSAVSVAPAKGPPGFKIPAHAECTVVLYNNRVAKAAFAFGKNELTPALAERVADAVEGHSETPYPLGYYAPSYTPARAITANGFGADRAALGPNPAVLIFTREVGPPVTALVQKLEEAAKNKAAKLDNFLVVLGDAKELEPRLKDLAAEHKLQSTTLSVEPAAKVRPFHVSKQNDITVLLCAGGVARGFYTFRFDAVNARSYDKLLADLDKTLKDRIAKGL